MTDHLPECRDDLTAYCICAALRACEQRVRENCGEHDRIAYAAALDAARDAVDALPYGRTDGLGPVLVERGKALAAIDALRGDA